MDNKDLRKLLQQLHDEVENTQTVDEQDSELLRDLDGHIRTLLDRSEENPVQVQPAFVGRLEETFYRFEVSHPRLTTLVSKVLDSLSNAGI